MRSAGELQPQRVLVLVVTRGNARELHALRMCNITVIGQLQVSFRADGKIGRDALHRHIRHRAHVPQALAKHPFLQLAGTKLAIVMPVREVIGRTAQHNARFLGNGNDLVILAMHSQELPGQERLVYVPVQPRTQNLTSRTRLLGDKRHVPQAAEALGVLRVLVQPKTPTRHDLTISRIVLLHLVHHNVVFRRYLLRFLVEIDMVYQKPPQGLQYVFHFEASIFQPRFDLGFAYDATRLGHHHHNGENHVTLAFREVGRKRGYGLRVSGKHFGIFNHVLAQQVIRRKHVHERLLSTAR